MIISKVLIDSYKNECVLIADKSLFKVSFYYYIFLKIGLHFCLKKRKKEKEKRRKEEKLVS